MANVPPGTKYDDNKRDWTMMPWDQLEVLAKVLEHGERKYARNNWQQVKDGKFRYLKAAFRHLIDWARGKELDDDSGLPHWAHAAVCLLFIGWFAEKEVVKPVNKEVCTSPWTRYCFCSTCETWDNIIHSQCKDDK